MAFDPAPSTWLGAGYSASSNAIHLQTADAASNQTLPDLTDAEAHATTGDIREIVRAFLSKIAAAWEATAEADRPAKMVVRKSLTFVDGGAQEAYSVSFDVGVTLGDVSAE